MIYDAFCGAFKMTADTGNGDLPTDAAADEDFVECLGELGGKTFERGLYRVYRGDQVLGATRNMSEVFPEFAKRILVFGYDWLGRHFAVDSGRVEMGKRLVLLLEPGAGEAMEIPAPIGQFHNEEIIEYRDDALAFPFYKQWRELNEVPIPHDQCVGYRVPLFLGGADTVDNLELIDRDVYVTLCGQLRNQTKHLKEGQTIGDIRVSD